MDRELQDMEREPQAVLRPLLTSNSRVGASQMNIRWMLDFSLGTESGLGILHIAWVLVLRGDSNVYYITWEREEGKHFTGQQ